MLLKGKILNTKTTKTPVPVAKFKENDVRRIQSAVTKRTDGIISKGIMWALPVLYPDDAIWSHDNFARHDCVLDLIDSSLELKTIVATGLHGLRVDRGQSLFEQHWAAKQYKLSAPRALTSHIAKRRYFARRPTRFFFENC